MRRTLGELAVCIAVVLGAVLAYGHHRESLGQVEADLRDARRDVATRDSALGVAAARLDSALNRAAVTRIVYRDVRPSLTPEMLEALPEEAQQVVEAADARDEGCSLLELRCAEYQDEADSLRAAQRELTDQYNRRIASLLRDKTTSQLTWGLGGIAIGYGSCLLLK